jgi:hypothetical protein
MAAHELAAGLGPEKARALSMFHALTGGIRSLRMGIRYIFQVQSGEEFQIILERLLAASLCSPFLQGKY